MKSARNTPLLGLAFLISAITALLHAPTLRRKAASKSRVSTRLSASARTAAKGTFFCAAAISSRLTATICVRMSDITSGRQRACQRHQLFELCLARARFDRRASLADARLNRVRDIGGIERGAGVEDHDVARRAGLIVEHAHQHQPRLLGRFYLQRAVAGHRQAE